MTYVPADDRYERMTYRRCGRSGVKLPLISLGLWHNFGSDRPLETQRAILRRAFDLGVCHFDLANNYGPPYGSAESNFGQLFAYLPTHARGNPPGPLVAVDLLGISRAGPFAALCIGVGQGLAVVLEGV